MASISETEKDLFPDYIKHLTGLSTGSLALIATFSDRFSNPATIDTVKTSIISFVLCIVCSTALYTLWLVVALPSKSEAPPWIHGIAPLLIMVMWLSFLVAIIALAWFALGNI